MVAFLFILGHVMLVSIWVSPIMLERMNDTYALCLVPHAKEEKKETIFIFGST